jgi:hypothetical protein
MWPFVFFPLLYGGFRSFLSRPSIPWGSERREQRGLPSQTSVTKASGIKTECPNSKWRLRFVVENREKESHLQLLRPLAFLKFGHSTILGNAPRT